MLQQKDKELSCLVSKIINTIEDESMTAQSYGLATYLLIKRPFDHCMMLCDKPNAKELLTNLIYNASDFISPNNRALGIEISSNIISDKMQKSLDVKQFTTGTQRNRIPSIELVAQKHNISILFSHATKIVFRVMCTRKDLIESASNDSELYDIGNNVYEIFINKTTPLQTAERVKGLVRIFTNINLLSGVICDLIFCTELSLFGGLDFLSNFIKFNYCILKQKLVFDPKTFAELHCVNEYLIYGLLFIPTNNLNIMSKMSHGPLCIYTGERPGDYLPKLNKKELYPIEGSRANMSIDKSSDIATSTSFIEIINKVKLDSNQLNNLI